MEHLVEYILAAVFLVWWILSFISQLNTKVRKKFNRQIFHLIPNYRFFAPLPISRDYHLEYRVLSRHLRPTKWKRVEFYGERSLFSTLWYPDKRKRKCFNTYAKRIIRVIRAYNKKAAKRSISYKHLVTYLQNLNEGKNSVGLQFRIISERSNDVDREARLVLASDWHYHEKNQDK